MMGEAEARGVLEAAFAVRGHSPTLSELQIAQAIGRFEGRYGAWIATNNWGAIQCGQKAPCPAGCVEHKDSHADGEVYLGCFRTYASPVDGAADLLHQLYRRAGVPAAMAAGSATATAAAMRATGYFEAPADKYALAILKHSELIAGKLGEPHAVTLEGGSTPPAGSGGDDVIALISVGAFFAVGAAFVHALRMPGGKPRGPWR